MKKRITANYKVLDITSPDELTDDEFLQYGQDALFGTLDQFYDMVYLDDTVESSTEAIELALIGYDYPNKQDNFSTSRDYFFFSRRSGGLVSLDKRFLLRYIKEHLDEFELFDWLKDHGYIEQENEMTDEEFEDFKKKHGMDF